MTTLADKLHELGFKADSKAKQAALAEAEAQGLSANGSYDVHAVYVKDGITVTVEQNQAPEDVGGLSAVITHPPVAIMESPKGRVAFNPQHLELVDTLIGELS